jgi:hypothetical protein
MPIPVLPLFSTSSVLLSDASGLVDYANCMEDARDGDSYQGSWFLNGNNGTSNSVGMDSRLVGSLGMGRVARTGSCSLSYSNCIVDRSSFAGRRSFRSGHSTCCIAGRDRS